MNDSHAHDAGEPADSRVRFCPMCASALAAREVFGRVRSACPACDYVHFEDPKVAVGVVAERDGEILLTRRNHEPKMGCWSFPSGFVDAGEDVQVAAIREALEETGIPVELDGLLGVYQESGSRVVYIAYAARAGGGEPVPDAESMEVRFFSADALPELAFPHDGEILSAWRKGQRRRA
ncbi:MAG TPA: NUDIX hydrolase [Dehalococcoidia bacterium]|nr:NUDIX hydrolase [Dehalococcoidia bacterium]